MKIWLILHTVLNINWLPWQKRDGGAASEDGRLPGRAPRTGPRESGAPGMNGRLVVFIQKPKKYNF